jgi:hypothetical protein
VPNVILVVNRGGSVADDVAEHARDVLVDGHVDFCLPTLGHLMGCWPLASAKPEHREQTTSGGQKF